MITRKKISSAELRGGFDETSTFFGFPPKKQIPLLADISALLSIWRNNLFVEIYELKNEYKYGRIKSSATNSSGTVCAYYTDFYHTRVKKNSDDPLLIITFEKVPNNDDLLVIENIITHDSFFGRVNTGGKKGISNKSRQEGVFRKVTYGRNKWPIP